MDSEVQCIYIHVHAHVHVHVHTCIYIYMIEPQLFSHTCISHRPRCLLPACTCDSCVYLCTCTQCTYNTLTHPLHSLTLTLTHPSPPPPLPSSPSPPPPLLPLPSSQYLSLMKELGEKVPEHSQEAAAGNKGGVGVGSRVPPPAALVRLTESVASACLHICS